MLKGSSAMEERNEEKSGGATGEGEVVDLALSLPFFCRRRLAVVATRLARPPSKNSSRQKKKKKKKKNLPCRRFFLFLGGVAAREGGGGMGARRPVRKVEGLGEGRRGEEVFEKKGKIHPSSCASVPELVSGRTATTNIRIKCYIDALSSLENSVEEMQKTKR